MKLEGSESKKRKKEKKTKESVNGSVEGDEFRNGCSEVIIGFQKSKNVEKRKSGKCKKVVKDTVGEVDSGKYCSPEAGHTAGKKKSVIGCVVNGRKVKSKTFSDVVNTVEQHTNKNFAVHVNDYLNESSVQQSKLHTKDDLASCVDKKQRKRKNKDNKKECLNSQDDVQEVSTHRRKKLKTDNESQDDKTVVSSSSIQPGAFENYRISQTMADNLRSKGIESLFPVQSVSFDAIYDGYDVIVQARTGSGKTLSFAIPLLEKMQKKVGKLCRGRCPKVLVMAPTRELAKQVSDTFEMFAATQLSVLSVYGGTAIYPQERSLCSGVDVLVGTPGRIKDLLEKGCLDLSQLSHVVLDEVDRMLDMGFADNVDSILTHRYSDENGDGNPQTLLFSATLPHWVHETAKKYLRPDRKHLDLICDDTVKTSKTVMHYAIRCGYHDRAATIGAVLQVHRGSDGRAMIFCETKRDADELALSSNIRQETHVIHGDIPQDKREMVLKGFRDGRYKCLIATDVAARGLDIPEVDLVVQCCPPKDVESYIHRSGRTGRAGRDGASILFFKPCEEYSLSWVEQRAGIKFKVIGPPSSQDVIDSCAKDAVRTLEAVTPATLSHFRHAAEQLVAERNVVDLLSAALAVVSGITDIKQRSILSSREGLTTLLYRTSTTMNGLGYAWKALERCFSAEITEKISWMSFCADRSGCVFDVPSDLADTLLTRWKGWGGESLEIPTTLPDLLQKDRPVERSSFGGRAGGWRKQSRGGSWNGRPRDFNRNGLMKRRSSWNASNTPNRRKTFD